MKKNDRVLSIAEMGAPTILIERLPCESEMHHCVNAYLNLVGSPEYNVKTGYLSTTGILKYIYLIQKLLAVCCTYAYRSI